MSVYMKRYIIWSVVYLAAICTLFWGTNLHLSWWQTGLLMLAISSYGAAERNLGHRDVEGK